MLMAWYFLEPLEESKGHLVWNLTGNMPKAIDGNLKVGQRPSMRSEPNIAKLRNIA